MQIKDIVAITIISVISAIVIAISIIMLLGRGTKFIAGYNTLSADEKRKFNATKLSKFLGKILLPIGLAFNGITIGIVCNIWWLPILVAAIALILSIVAIIYCNVSNSFKNY